MSPEKLGYQYDVGLHEAAKRAAERHRLCVSTPYKAPPEFDLEVLARAYLDLLEKRGLPPFLICEPSIQLTSGGYFNFLEPYRYPIKPEDIAGALSKIARFNGHNKSGFLAYTVAQHSVHACENAPEEYKFEALMHDSQESLVGDTTTPLKQLCPDFQKYEDAAAGAIAYQFHLPTKMSPIVKQIDIRMAATEKRDLMVADQPGDEWEFLRQIKPYPDKIEIWNPCIARMRWLDTFNELWPIHEKNWKVKQALNANTGINNTNANAKERQSEWV
jgi:5'-deoxynucleotidase YfbR-like HD superfamily hydrolase